MKKHNKFSAKLLSLALVMAMVVCVLPGKVYAREIEESSETENNSEAEAGEAPVMLTEPKTIAKRMLCLDLRFHTDAPLDKDGNTLMSEDGIFDMLDAEGWKWDRNTLTLTLNGVNIETTGYNHALELPENKGDVTIVLEGENTLVSEGWDALAAWSNLNIDGTGSLNAICKQYAAIAVTGNLTINGGTFNVGLLEGGSNTKAIRTNGNINISGGDITAKGNLSAIWAGKNMVIDNTKVMSKSSTENAIGANGKLVIQNNADITAESVWPPLFSSGDMSIAGSVVNATSKARVAINSAGNITFTDSNIAAKSILSNYTAIYTDKTITIDGSSQVLAEGDYRGIHGVTAVLIKDAAQVAATGTKGDGIYSTGKIRINGGRIYAKGGEGNMAIRTQNVQKETEDAVPNIIIENALEKNGGKAAFSDWNNGTSWTTVIPKDDVGIIIGDDGKVSNGLREVWLAAPYTVTFDNADGTTSAVKVYPDDKVAAPATDPAKDGFHFNGWYLENTKFDFVNTPITGNITLKAKLDAHTPNKDDGDCTTAILCSACSTEITAAKEHVLSNWQSDATNHWKNCDNTGCTHTSQNAAHTRNAGEETTPPTHTQDGVKTYTCTVCGQTKTETIPKLPFNSALNNGNADSPQTSDGSPVLLFVLMILASGIALVILTQKRKIVKHIRK